MPALIKKSIIYAFFAATILSGCIGNSRVKDFKEFLVNRADSLALAKCTEENMQMYSDSYKKDPSNFEFWINQIKEHQKGVCRELSNDCSVIKNLDKEYGRELSFEEAFQIIMSRPDTTAPPDSVVMLQRLINSLNEYTEHITIWEESKKMDPTIVNLHR